MSIRRLLQGLLFGALVLSAGVVRAQEAATPEEPPPDPSAAFFDDSTLGEVRLRIHTADWQKLVDNYGSNEYYPTDFVFQGQTVYNVGIRSRGSGSRNPFKPGLRVDFNRYSGEQEFLGLTSFVLDNLYQDPTMLRERLAMKLMAKMNVDAPRERFVKLWVNSIYMGIYAAAESIDKRFLKRAQGLDADGYIFEYKWQDKWLFNYLGSELEPYEARFAARTHENESSSTLQGPIEDFVRAVNESSDVIRDIGPFLRIQTFLRELAVDTFLADWDGLVGDFGINNFYLYRVPNGKESQFIPWDKDFTFKAKDYPVWPDGMNENVLVQKLLDRSDLRDYYFNALLECARLAEERVGEPGADGALPPPWLEQEVERQYQQIRQAAHDDGHKPVGNEVFDAEVEVLREFARFRPGFVRDFVAGRRGTASSESVRR